MTNEIELYAWIGEDELGSGEIGLKQALVPAGYIPLVSTSLEKINQEYIREALQEQANTYKKTIRLCKFVMQNEITSLEPGPRWNITEDEATQLQKVIETSANDKPFPLQQLRKGDTNLVK